MITLLTGENSYEVERELGRIIAAFDGIPDKIDGAEVEVRQLPDLLMGMSLFADKRLVIIRGLSANKQAWEALPELVGRISDDIHLVLVESSVDKRTRGYKTLQKAAQVKDFQLWGERDRAAVERWAREEAARMGMRLDVAAVKALVGRCFVMSEKGQPVVDQWRVMHSLEKLSVFEKVTAATIERYIDEQPIDSVFSIFETALRGDRAALHQLLADIEPKEDPFKVFGLLSSQVFQLVALASSDESATGTAKAIGVHPYAASKLELFAKRYSKQQIKEMVLALRDADEALKRSKASPWILIEQALMKVVAATKGN